MKRLMILTLTALLVIVSSLNSQPSDDSGYDNSSNMEVKQSEGYGLRGNQNGGGKRQKRMQEMLNLTDEQKAKVSDLRFEHEKMVVEVKSEIGQNQLIIREMMRDNKIDQDKLLQSTKEISEFHAKIKLSKTTMWLDVYQILDEKQREEWTKVFGKDGRGGKKGRNYRRQSRGGNCQKDCCRKLD